MPSPRSSSESQRSTGSPVTHGSPGSHKSTSTTSSRGANPTHINVDYFYRPGKGLRKHSTGSKVAASAQLSRVQQGSGYGIPRQVGFTLPVKIHNIVYRLFIDTGSPLAWVEDRSAAQKKAYDDASHNVLIEYGDKSELRGRSEITDVHYQTTPAETVLHHLIAAGHLYRNKMPCDEMGDGILGLSPSERSGKVIFELRVQRGVLSRIPLPHDIENAVSALRDEGIIGIFFTPYGIQRQAQLTFKGFNDRKFLQGYIPIYIPIIDKDSGFWAVKQTMKFGANMGALPSSSNVSAYLDTGHPSIDLTAAGFADYKKITGAVEKEGRLVLTEAQYLKLESLWFSWGGHDFEITRDAQLWPRRQNKLEGFADDDYVLIVGSTRSNYMMYGLPWCTCSFSAFSSIVLTEVQSNATT